MLTLALLNCCVLNNSEILRLFFDKVFNFVFIIIIVIFVVLLLRIVASTLEKLTWVRLS